MMVGITVFGQAQNSGNRFGESQSPSQSGSGLENEEEDDPGHSGLDDDDDVPIDDYLPLLALTALGGIVYTVRKRQKQTL
ncbi:MAG: hypothetical protein QM564_11300 [Bergeyella sp.]